MGSPDSQQGQGSDGPSPLDPVHLAEQRVLGAMMLSASAVEPVHALVGSADFYTVAHATIFTAIMSSWQAGEPTEPVAITMRLDASGDLKRVGGVTYLHDIVANAASPVQAGFYARAVAEASRTRGLEILGARLNAVAAVEDPARRLDLVNEVRDALIAIDTGPATDTWKPIDLGPYVRGEVELLEPSIGIARSDGVRLLYPGREHSVIGEMESGKSWFSLACCAAELLAGAQVCYVHFEEPDPADTVVRLLALGVSEKAIMEQLRFVGPETPVDSARMSRLLDSRPSLFVLDGVNEGLSLHGHSAREEDAISAFRRALVRPALVAGAAVLTCDHVVKDPEKRGRYGLGSVHKGNALTGVLISLETADPMGRDRRGRSHVYVMKDRPGFLRRVGRPTSLAGKTFLGELIVDDTRERVSYLDLQFIAPRSDADRELDAATQGDPEERQVLAAVRMLIEQGLTANVTRLRQACRGMRGAAVSDALTRMEISGLLTLEYGSRGAKFYRPTASQWDEQEPPAEDDA